MSISNHEASEHPDFGTWLQSLGEPFLKEILANRPDATFPLPPGIRSLAARLKLRTSTRRAIFKLNASDIAVLEATAELGGELKPVDAPEITTQLHDLLPDLVVADSIQRLLTYALVFGTTDRIQIAPEVMAAFPQQWSLIESAHQNRDEVAAALAAVTAPQRKILDTLITTGGSGITKDAGVDADPSRPVPQLLKAGLLHRIDAKTVRLPYLVRCLLTEVEPPVISLAPITVAEHPPAPAEIDKQLAAAALEALRLVRTLIEHLGHSPTPLLKDGALGVRALAGLRTVLDCEEKTALRVISVALAARLIDRGFNEATEEQVLAPTTLSADFLAAPLAEGWALIVTSWWRYATVAPWRVEKPIRALSAETVVSQLPQWRRQVLASCDQPLTRAELRQIVHYHAPLAAGTLDAKLITEILNEACWLGVVYEQSGVLYPAAILALLLAGGDAEDLLALTTAQTPAAVEILIPQGDMTLLAPGPLTHQIQQEVSLFTDIESPGLASVYRISERSIQRAFDAGRTAEDLLAFLHSHVLGELPQTVEFLIKDIARRHGHLRGGPALSYLRCDDEALLLQLSNSEVAAHLALRLLAPTVAISQAPLSQVFTALKEAGFHPVAENAEGLSIDIRQKPLRLPTPKAAAIKNSEPDPEHLAAALQSLRSSTDETATSAVTDTSDLSPLTTIQTAIRLKQRLRIGVVDGQGIASRFEVTPIAVTGGQVSALDQHTGQLHHFQIYRVTEAVIVKD